MENIQFIFNTLIDSIWFDIFINFLAAFKSNLVYPVMFDYTIKD